MISQDMHKLVRHILYARARQFCLNPKSQELPQNFPVSATAISPFPDPLHFWHTYQTKVIYMSIKNWYLLTLQWLKIGSLIYIFNKSNKQNLSLYTYYIIKINDFCYNNCLFNLIM